MSRTDLKRALSGMSREGLEEIILELYQYRKDAKEYFDFFINPDVEKLLEKKVVIIQRECRRNRRGYSRMRISVVRTAVSHFASFNPGDSYVLKLMFISLDQMEQSFRLFHLTDAQQRSILRFLSDMFKFSEKQSLFVEFMSLLDQRMSGDRYSVGFRRLLTGGLVENGIELK